MASSTTECAKCGTRLPDDVAGEERIPCSACGATARRYIECIEDGLVVYDSLRGKAKRPSLPSAKKLRWDSFNGYEISKSLGRMVKVERTIDKDADWYSERVIDPISGEVIHECHEPLSVHVNHGTAKRKL